MHPGFFQRILCASLLFISTFCCAERITTSNVFDTCRFVRPCTLIVCAAEPRGTPRFFQELKETQVLHKLSLINNDARANNVKVVGVMPAQAAAELKIDNFNSIRALQDWVRLREGIYTSILYFSTQKGLSLLGRAEVEKYLPVSSINYVQYNQTVAPGNGKVVQTRQISDVLKYVTDDKKTLVLFDIDSTVLEAIEFPAQGEEKGFWCYVCVERNKTIEVINDLKEREFEIMFLSSRPMSSAQVSYECLLEDFGIDVSTHSLFAGENIFLVETDQGTHPYLRHYKGICTIGPEGPDEAENIFGNFKGRHIKQLLIDHIPRERWPKRIILVDDSPYCVWNVVKELKDFDPNIEILGVWYTRYNEDRAETLE